MYASLAIALKAEGRKEKEKERTHTGRAVKKNRAVVVEFYDTIVTTFLCETRAAARIPPTGGTKGYTI